MCILRSISLYGEKYEKFVLVLKVFPCVDSVFGKFRTILYLSILYAIGQVSVNIRILAVFYPDLHFFKQSVQGRIVNFVAGKFSKMLILIGKLSNFETLFLGLAPDFRF